MASFSVLTLQSSTRNYWESFKLSSRLRLHPSVGFFLHHFFLGQEPRAGLGGTRGTPELYFPWESPGKTGEGLETCFSCHPERKRSMAHSSRQGVEGNFSTEDGKGVGGWPQLDMLSTRGVRFSRKDGTEVRRAGDKKEK